MIGYYLVVPGMTVQQLTSFAAVHMPDGKTLHRRARRAKLPALDPISEEPIEVYIARYEKVPTDDLAMRVLQIGQHTSVQFLASGGGCTNRAMKEGLAKIVRRHLARELRTAGFKPVSYQV